MTENSSQPNEELGNNVDNTYKLSTENRENNTIRNEDSVFNSKKKKKKLLKAKLDEGKVQKCKNF